MIKNWGPFPDFRRAELDSPDQPGSGDMMDADFMARLQGLRTVLKRTFKINSGYRTASHNKAVGGGVKSAHLRGRAVDINWMGWPQENKDTLVRLARKLGFTGCGIGHGFVHLDDVGAAEGYKRPLQWDYLAGGHASNYRQWA